MTGKKITWIILLIIVLAAIVYGYKEYTRTNKQLINARADYIITADSLIKEYETNDSIATAIYNGRIIEVSGAVKSVEKDNSGFYTVILGSQEGLSAVRCSIDSGQAAKAAEINNGSSVIIRGVCTGFNKDELGLGSDVILNRCAIINKKISENENEGLLLFLHFM